MKKLTFMPLILEVEDRLRLIDEERKEIQQMEVVGEVPAEYLYHFRLYLGELSLSRKGSRERKRQLKELVARWDNLEQKRYGLRLIRSQLMDAHRALENAGSGRLASGSELRSLLEKQLFRFEDWLGGFGQKPANLRKNPKQD